MCDGFLNTFKLGPGVFLCPFGSFNPFVAASLHHLATGISHHQWLVCKCIVSMYFGFFAIPLSPLFYVLENNETKGNGSLWVFALKCWIGQ